MNDQPGRGLVYVVDDDPSVLRMLEALIGSIDLSVRAFSNAADFLEIYQPAVCECLVCDMRMPEIGGLELQKRLLAKGATLPIIFLTGHAEVALAVECMKNGAFDFVEKPFGAQALLDKVQQALERSCRLHAERRHRSTIEARLALLTPKEQKIAKLVSEGKSSRDISEIVGCSVRTVENHRAHILEKLHVNSTVELVRLFL
ncbi:response regulator transcription factor [Methylococcus sp. EFPC2]|uniref:response regulator transcription factor n=1 Tax=Methylococcus sp. EFPC2 TaxID=2812648 RepID=UPI001967E4EA|nr:response regulator [Methylococcus sp. EFPC2]QSA98477.1 response regulator transcription factor [Methylococcus sp. EFPC2]